MKKQMLLASVFVLGGATLALADNKSRFGEGTALDPRGIHDARATTRENAGDEPFRGAGLSGPMDLTTSFARQGPPDTIDVSSISGGNGGETSGSGAASGGNGGGGNGGGGNGGGGNGGGGNGGR